MAQKVLTSLQGTSTGGRATAEFTQLYQQKFSSTLVELADYGYDAMNVLALAVDAVGAKMKTVANPPGTTVF